MRVALIVNPAAASINSRSRVRIQRALADRHELKVVETSRRGHATRLAHRAVRDGYELVVTLGGDGTVNEAANGLLGTDVPLAPLPGGSTNVFARAIGYPNDAVEATRVLLAAVDAGSIRPGSLGLANGRVFVFNVGIGFDADVVHRVEERGILKRWAGHPWFIYNAVRSLASKETRSTTFEILTIDGRHRRNLRMAVAMNVNPYTYLGNAPLALAPEAGLDAPLSVVSTDSFALMHLSPVIGVVLGRRPDGLPDEGAFGHWAGVHAARVTADRPFRYQLDGEPQDPVTELVLEHRPEAIRVLVP